MNRPRVNANGETIRPATRLESIQERAFSAGENFGRKAGFAYGDITGASNVRVRTEVNENFRPNQQEVSGFESRKTKLEISSEAHPNDVKIHEEVAKQTRSDNSLVNQTKEKIFGANSDTPVNSRKYELELEANKHNQMAEWREKMASEFP